MKIIIYGAGRAGESALEFFGEENVFCFADTFKFGGVYHGKRIISLDELKTIEEYYDIVIAGNIGIAKLLLENNINRFRFFTPIADFRELCPPNYISRQHFEVLEYFYKTLPSLDFIDNPDYLDEYRQRYEDFSALKRDDRLPSIPLLYSESLEGLLYGYLPTLARYCERDVDFSYAPTVKHGSMWSLDELYQGQRVICCMGDAFVAELHEHFPFVPVFRIGPYVRYAENYYDKSRLASFKEASGKNLLVFPAHSSVVTKLSFDELEFADIMLKEAERFDSLTVCITPNCLRSDTLRILRSNGARVVSAGFPYDPVFLRRLRTIIETADAVLTNVQGGSHLGYCIALGKPVKYVPQRIELIQGGMFTNIIWANLQKRNPTEILSIDKYEITNELHREYEPGFGFSKVKTKKEIGAIFDVCELIARDCKYKLIEYENSVKKVYKELRGSADKNERLMFRLLSEALGDVAGI